MGTTNTKLDEFKYNTKRPVDCATDFPKNQNFEQVKGFKSTHQRTQIRILVSTLCQKEYLQPSQLYFLFQFPSTNSSCKNDDPKNSGQYFESQKRCSHGQNHF